MEGCLLRNWVFSVRTLLRRIRAVSRSASVEMSVMFCARERKACRLRLSDIENEQG